jgi:hypothetical protein
MIKKLLLMACMPFIGLTIAAAQCTPDQTIDIPGIYPDTLPKAIVGENYSEVVQFYVPGDSTFEISPGTYVTATVESVELDSVEWSGLDSKGFSYACNPGTCEFPGKTNGCLLVSGVAPTSDMIGEYPLVLYLTYHLTIFGAPFDTAQAVTDFSVIVDSAGSSGIKILDLSKFQVLQNIPNPFSATTSIEYSSSNASSYNFIVYNMLGESVYSENVNAKKGLNKISFNATNLQEGLYLYSLSNEKQSIVKRMTVSK